MYQQDYSLLKWTTILSYEYVPVFHCKDGVTLLPPIFCFPLYFERYFMKFWSSFVISFLFISLAGCAGLSPAEKRIGIYKADPPANCEDLGAVNGWGTVLGTQDEERDNMRRRAARKGANYIRLETSSKHMSESGTAFRCPNL